MKLDRNVNADRRGKYALVNMRMVGPLLDKNAAALDSNTGAIVGPIPDQTELDIVAAFELLLRHGYIALGNESPGDQFFVLKYKDKFTPKALAAYAEAIKSELTEIESKTLAITIDCVTGGAVPSRHAHLAELRKRYHALKEWHQQIFDEVMKATELGDRIPD